MVFMGFHSYAMKKSVYCVSFTMNVNFQKDLCLFTGISFFYNWIYFFFVFFDPVNGLKNHVDIIVKKMAII